LVTYAFMAATIAALTFLYGLTSTLLTHFLAEKVRANPMISRVLEKVAGVFLVGFGIKLVVSR
jgi:threonine/homoserine/homoserine lactone efflux protein